MTAPTKERTFPFQTGFCGVNACGRCPAVVAGVDCTHFCHTQDTTDAPVLSASVEVPQPVTANHGLGDSPTTPPTVDLGDALAQIIEGIGGLDQALVTFEGSDVEMCDLLGHVRHERQRLAELESLLERATAKAMRQDVIEWPGGIAERRHGKDRKEWDHDALVRVVTAAIIPPLCVNPVSGEMDRELAALLHLAVEQYAATNRPTWRVTAIKPLGIDPDDFCTAVPGRSTVQVNLATPTEVPA